MRKRLLAIFIALVSFWIGVASTNENCTDCDPVFASTPHVQTLTSIVTGEVTLLENRTYVVGYGEDRMSPLWVSYRIFGTSPVGSAPNYGWRIDHRTEERVSDSGYKYTGFQRGHMAPKSATYHCYGANAVHDTFQLSNASPQSGELNDGPWGDLEDLVRENYSLVCEEIWVIAGPIFDDSNGREYLTKDEAHACMPQKPVEIPDAFYKIIIDMLDGEVRTLAFIMEQSEGYGYGTGDSVVERLSGFLKSIDEIEAKTGLDFSWNLDATTEERLEAEPASVMW